MAADLHDLHIANESPGLAWTTAFQTIAPQDLAQMLTHKDFVLVNVHLPYEDEIAQTEAFIPFDQISAVLSKLPADTDAKIVLYCRSGRMSQTTANTLVGLGYTHVAHLGGGMIACEAMGNRCSTSNAANRR